MRRKKITRWQDRHSDTVIEFEEWTGQYVAMVGAESVASGPKLREVKEFFPDAEWLT